MAVQAAEGMTTGARPLFRWRWLVASEQGPNSPVTRHVLLTLAIHMDENGQGAFPSIATLALETGLSDRSVGKHLKCAKSAGWITRKLWREDGKDWARYSYSIAFPPIPAGTEPRSPPNALGRELRAPGQELEGDLVPNHVPTNSTENSTSNSTGPLPDERQTPETTVGREAFSQLVKKMTGHAPERGERL